MRVQAMLKSIGFLVLFSLVHPLLSQQAPTQTIRGQVLNALTGQAIEGANVRLAAIELGTSTDANGHYRLEDLPIGRYELQVSVIGYESQLVTELLLESGKELIQTIYLEEQTEELDEVVVKAVRAGTDVLAPLSAYTLTIEETLRFPGTFFDPARLATNMAGVVNTNDQANNMIIRGNSPTGLLWRLEGADIVNPNHLSNAGTFSDRPTANGGGVNILSAQMLGTSHFLTGAFPANYGNALAGVLDMRLRKGNDERHEFTAQASLIGLDVAAEGPLNKETDASFLANYRYSTLGLFTALGLELGDEAIDFQDLAINFSIPTQKAGRFTVMAMGGLSGNTFEGGRVDSLWEFEKDRQDIRYENKMGAIGLTHVLPIGTKSVWRSALVASGVDTRRLADRLDDTIELRPFARDEFEQSKLSFATNYTSKIAARHQLKVGLIATRQTNKIDYLGSLGTPFEVGGDSWLLQGFANWQNQLSEQLEWTIGLHLIHFALNGTSSLEPRTSLNYQFGTSLQQEISLAYGLHSQMQLPQLYYEQDDQGKAINRDLGFTKAHHLVLGYQVFWKRTTSLRLELYYQRLFDVPVDQQMASSFSVLNMIELYRPAISGLENSGTGTNYGLELSWQKYFSHQYYFLFNTALYESTYEGSDGEQRDTRFNGNYVVNLNAGKEFQWAKKGKERLFGVNVRLAFVGGLRESPIDGAASAVAGRTVFVNTAAFSLRQQHFFRPDLRLYYKNNKQKRNSTVSLDIQNVANVSNVAYRYYDTEQQAVIVKNQLGLIPILSYRLEF